MNLKSDIVKNSATHNPVDGKIAIIGIGRMGKGIALAFAYAGYPVTLIDSEDRPDPEFDGLKEATVDELQAELEFLADINIISTEQISEIKNRVLVLAKSKSPELLKGADFIFEAVMEVKEIKESVYSWLNHHISDQAIVSSTTSTMSADILAEFVNNKERFVNGHWLNPAHLMPLVEVSPSKSTNESTVDKIKALFEGIGKVPVVCKASPGFIISRIQALALNEATRLVEEGVASAEDIDKAIKTSFGIRYATLGLLEFIDWGGGDILYHATSYLGESIDPQRFSVSELVRKNMENNKNGIRDGIGFYNWEDCDIDLYRRGKLTDLVKLLQHRDLIPEPDVFKTAND